MFVCCGCCTKRIEGAKQHAKLDIALTHLSLPPPPPPPRKGSYYNSLPEMCYTGFFLSVSAIAVAGLSMVEISICAAAGGAMTILDHCPVEFWRRKRVMGVSRGVCVWMGWLGRGVGWGCS